MNSNSSQTGQCPSEPSIFNNKHQSDIDPLLSLENMTTTASAAAANQSSSLLPTIQLNPTDMVANVQQQEHNNVNLRQNVHPNQHQNHQQQQQQIQRQQNRQEQQRRLNQHQQFLEQELQRVQQQQQRLRQETQRERQRRRQEAQRERQRQEREREQQRFREWLESQNLTYEQWEERQNQEREQRLQERLQREEERRRQRQQQWEHELYLERLEWEHDQYLLRRSPGFNEDIDELLTERELEQYQFDRMSSQERQETWEQEHLKELQGYVPSSRPNAKPMDEFERHGAYQEEQLWKDDLEQILNIDDMEKWDTLEQHHRNEEQLIQKKQWEEIAFLYQQQLQQPTHASL